MLPCVIVVEGLRGVCLKRTFCVLEHDQESCGEMTHGIEIGKAVTMASLQCIDSTDNVELRRSKC